MLLYKCIELNTDTITDFRNDTKNRELLRY